MAMICSDAAWHDAWTAANAKGGVVQVKVTTLREIFDCAGGKTPPGVVVEVGRVWAWCSRPGLFDFLNNHGRECGKNEGA